MMKHFLNRVFNYKNTSLGAQSTLNSGKYWTKLNSTGTKSFTSSFDEELFHNLGKLFLAYWHKPSMVSLIISLNIIHVCNSLPDQKIGICTFVSILLVQKSNK